MRVLEMKTLQCVVCTFFVICLLDITRGRDFTDIWSNLPSDLGNAVSTAWKSVIKAIKTPVKVRRLGRGRRKKTTTTSTTMENEEAIQTSYHLPTDVPRRPTIPILTQPEWRSLLDWRILHRPNLVRLAQEFHHRGAPSMYGRDINSYEGSTLKLTTYDEDDHFEHDTIYREKKEEPRNKINIPLLPKPKYKYEYLWKPKYTVPYSTKTTASTALSVDATFNQFYSSRSETTTQIGALLKELKFGKYRLKIFYKLSFD